MRPADNMRKLFRKLHIPTSPGLDKKIYDEISRVSGQTNKNKPTIAKPVLWRIIMKSKITKFAAAAVILVAVITGINYYNGSINITTIAFADMTEAMKNKPWVHITDSGLSTSMTWPSEIWIGFQTKTQAVKMLDGNVAFINFSEHKSYIYDPKNRSITIDYVYENDLPQNFSSAVSIIESLNKQLEAQGAQITTSLGEYKAKKVQIQETTSSVNNSNYSMRLYIQPDSKLLLSAQVKMTDSEGNTKNSSEIFFDYPQTGPVDIYALDIPRDALIIDKLPSADFMAVWNKYREKSADATVKYIAIVTHSSQFSADIINMVDADYKSGQNHRWERHSVYKTGQEYEKFWPEYKKQLGDSFESSLAWTKAHYKDSGTISVYLYDGRYDYSAKRDDKDQWSDIIKNYSPESSNMPNEILEDIGWPFIGKTGHIIEDDYAKQNNLICIERLQQGSIYKNTVSLPARFLYYLDSQKDYLCLRKITEWRPNAEWQEDKNWLEGIEPEKISNGSITIEDITNSIQAENGHWYPQTVEIKQTGIREDYKEAPLKISSTKKIYLKTNPNFPEGIFDPEKLTR